jgi:curved DNA-binding protein CbpA
MAAAASSDADGATGAREAAAAAAALPEMERDLYELLGVAPEASEDVLASAFRKRALELHPDRNPDVPKALFQLLHKAKELLLDPTRRAEYDARRRAREARKRKLDEMGAEARALREALERREREAATARREAKAEDLAATAAAENEAFIREMMRAGALGPPPKRRRPAQPHQSQQQRHQQQPPQQQRAQKPLAPISPGGASAGGVESLPTTPQSLGDALPAADARGGGGGGASGAEEASRAPIDAVVVRWSAETAAQWDEARLRALAPQAASVVVNAARRRAFIVCASRADAAAAAQAAEHAGLTVKLHAASPG